ncbi:zinc knuckle (CCHC-type) family protein [Striga asiatica]|uniref:Zinc knuckle (CCHC-type) family protein n=1 Tax=Striga asiatica TaxID=4170 RepID=A0A5A7QXY6_STRAF|nr:zinc knuckle (CCHC-type) family protein [Striga asiatica]
MLPATGSVQPVTTSSLDHSGGSAGSGGGRQRLCSQCGKTEHLAASCFEVIGFPEWYPRGGGGRRGGRRGRGGRSGRAPVQANVAAAAVQVGANSNVGLASSDCVLSGLTDEQWTQLKPLHLTTIHRDSGCEAQERLRRSLGRPAGKGDAIRLKGEKRD